MKLVAFSVESYRRFVAKTSVKLHGDIIAFVGPNEAGKSSLLKALSHLNHDEPWEFTESPRRSDTTPRLSWHLQLEEHEKNLLIDIPEAHGVDRVVVQKGADHIRRWSLKPSGPVRDRSKRQSTATLMHQHRESYSFSIANDFPESDFQLADYDRAIGLLESETEDFTPDEIGVFSHMADLLDGMIFAGIPDDSGQSLEDQEKKFQEARTSIKFALEEVVRVESTQSPLTRTLRILGGLLPKVMYFGDSDRNLASRYDLAEVAGDPPNALNHLRVLAHLDLKALHKEATAGRIADVATRRNAGNKALLDAFDQSWNQQGIAIQFEVQGTVLHIQATTPEDAGLSDIAERSDGMRWFAALLAYAYGWEGRPVLLVDEIETHLHYDAQADVIGVLSKQLFTSKVIYTTHSFGCLPYDLGTGVRVVQPIDAATSRLETGFWKGGAGFTPLLASMGAAAMSFTPTKYALIAEGPSDAILLPSLLRQASDIGQLGFHIAPGVSSVAAMAVEELDAEAGRVAFIVDGDEGGLAHADKLIEHRVAEERIIVLKTSDEEPLESEDLIDPRIYARAVMDEVRLWGVIEIDLLAEQLPAHLRTKYIESWCNGQGLNPPDKVAVAQRVVDMGGEQSIFDPAQQVRLVQLMDHIRSILKLP